MSAELRPLGVACNIQCQYCYQTPERDAGNVLARYDLAKMKAGVEAAGGGFTMFGGEPLLVREEDLEELWSWGLEKFGQNSIQTNAALINENHIRMFKQYKVDVGISLDGPGALNDARWAGSLRRTREATAKIEKAIERLCDEGIPPSLIITLHRNNATADKLPTMLNWVRYLEMRGVRSMRLHTLEVESEAIRERYALSDEENVAAMMAFAELEAELRTLSLDVFTDVRRLLVADDDRVTCIWAACDPYTTRAVQGIEGNGQRSNCGRTNKLGIDFVKADREGFERYLALYHTPREYGGCKDCRFFLMCKGECPGTAIGGDWRNRTEQCKVWEALFEHFEAVVVGEGHTPVSLRPDRRRIEQHVLATWAQGRTTSIRKAIAEIEHLEPA